MGALKNPAPYKQLDGIALDEQWDNPVEILSPLTANGMFKWDENIGLLEPTQISKWVCSPWVHNPVLNDQNCGLDSMVIFDYYNIIPPRCQGCWKVCMGLNTYHQVRQMEALQHSWPTSCKVGCEVREYVPKIWGAYFYNDSLEEGYDTWEKVKEVVREKIDGSTEPDKNGKTIIDGIILKRGCTEMEYKIGPSPYWKNTEDQIKLMKYIERYIHWPNATVQQPLESIAQTHRRWLDWAHACGDMTYVPYNGGKRLYPGYVTYHDAPKEEVVAAYNKVQEQINSRPQSQNKGVHLEKETKTNGEIQQTVNEQVTVDDERRGEVQSDGE